MPRQYLCPRCGRIGEWTDGTETEYWCQVCGAETEARLIESDGSRDVIGPDDPEYESVDNETGMPPGWLDFDWPEA